MILKKKDYIFNKRQINIEFTNVTTGDYFLVLIFNSRGERIIKYHYMADIHHGKISYEGEIKYTFKGNSQGLCQSKIKTEYYLNDYLNRLK